MSDEGSLVNGRRFGRREFLVAGAGAGVALAGPLNYGAIARAARTPIAKGGKFTWGVASGMPSSHEVTLWTRLGGIDRSSKLRLEVAKDKHFKHVIDHREVLAKESRDFTVHQRIKGLKPHHEYFYRFETLNKHSRVGTFRTLPPADSNQKLRIGFYSCQSYDAGYYTAHKALAKEDDLDFVLCLGDYIYERVYYSAFGPAGRVDTTGTNNDGDVQTLDEYREKYRFYQSDPDLQDAHAAHSFILMRDDHEVEDNYAGDQPDSAATDPNFENNGTYPRRVPFATRRKAGYRAFFEALPRIQPFPDRNKVYGKIPLGTMANLYLTDERQYRDPQPCMDVQLTGCADDDAPGRTYLGSDQKDWLKRAVGKSEARWNLLASETMMMALDSSPGVHANQDQWDGYAAEREEILTSFLDDDVENLVVLSGDIHTFVAGNLTTTGEQSGTPAGVELVGGSLTSFGLPEETGIPVSVLQSLAATADPHVIYVDFETRGYCVIEVTEDKLVGEFKGMTTTQDDTGTPFSLAKFQVDSGDKTLQQLS